MSLVVDLFRICQLLDKPALSVIETQKLSQMIGHGIKTREMILKQLGTENNQLNVKLKKAQLKHFMQ